MMQWLMLGRGYWRHSLATVGVVVLSSLLAGSTMAAQSGVRETGHVGHAGFSDIVHQETPPAAPPVGSESALRLQSLLGQHSMLVADMMRGRIRGDEDFAQAANGALVKNTDGLAALVTSLLGEQAAAQFKSLWGAHVTAFFDYARGLADHDNAVRDKARATLTTFERDLAGFFAGASQGRLNLETAQAAVLVHVDHLLRQADAYVARDYATADRIYREGYAHAYVLGKALAGALLAPDQASALETPTWRLRSELGRLFGQHVELIVDATRSAVTNSADFATAADGLNANTRELAGAMDSLFGAASAAKFQSLWADHVDQVMAYTAGVVARDAKRRDDAVRKLTAFEGQLGSFLNTATAGKLDAAHLAKDMVAHDQMLMRHADAFAAKDYRKAHDLAYETYEYAPELAGELADAFGATVASRLPRGGPETGQGGMRTAVGRR